MLKKQKSQDEHFRNFAKGNNAIHFLRGAHAGILVSYGKRKSPRTKRSKETKKGSTEAITKQALGVRNTELRKLKKPQPV